DTDADGFAARAVAQRTAHAAAGEIVFGHLSALPRIPRQPPLRLKNTEGAPGARMRISDVSD
ncbi:MAG: hypothetical protein V3R74_01215, partial [Alphaproteobacteria bacterium]